MLRYVTVALAAASTISALPSADAAHVWVEGENTAAAVNIQLECCNLSSLRTS